MNNIFLLVMCSFLAGCGTTKNADSSLSCSISPIVYDPDHILYGPWAKKSVLKGGLSGAQIFKVIKGKTTYVWRQITNRNMTDRVREINAQVTASRSGYGPKLYAYDAHTGVILMEALEACDHHISATLRLQALAHALKTMHSGPAFCAHMPLQEQTKVLVKTTPRPLSSAQKRHIHAILETQRSFKDTLKTATHRDLNPNNIFVTQNGVKFIDFENAGLDDPYIDLAAVSLFYMMTHQEQTLLLSAYHGRRITEDDMVHLQWARRLVCVFQGLTLHQIAHARAPRENAPQPLRSALDLGTALTRVYEGKLVPTRSQDVRCVADAFLKEALNK
ncbi:MAG: phosphotransferase [Proteobacteria bacterium]|nr:phosphotransferase [Pseudomonadota bacterium]